MGTRMKAWKPVHRNSDVRWVSVKQSQVSHAGSNKGVSGALWSVHSQDEGHAALTQTPVGVVHVCG